MIKFSYKPLPAYIPPNNKITYEYEKEEEKYTLDFIKKNNCHKYHPHIEFEEYWNGLNKIRAKYGLENIVQVECKCGGNELKE